MIYTPIWRAILLNDIIVKIDLNTDKGSNWTPPEVPGRSVLLGDGMIGRADASQNCYRIDNEVIGVEEIKRVQFPRLFFNHNRLQHNADVRKNDLVFGDHFYYNEGAQACVLFNSLYGFISRTKIENYSAYNIEPFI